MAAIHPEPLAEDGAIEILFERYSSQLLRFCRGRLGSQEDAEDALQLTYLYALLALRRGVTPAFESAWLHKIADNVCRSRKRSAGRRDRMEVTADTDELKLASPEADATALIGIDDALAAIPARQRQAILLREWQGLSYKEIARQLDLSQSAVETLIFRARRSLATALEGGGRLPRASAFALLGNLGSLLNGLRATLSAPALQAAAAGAIAASVLTVMPGDQRPAQPADWRPTPPATIPAEATTETPRLRPSSQARGSDQRPNRPTAHGTRTQPVTGDPGTPHGSAEAPSTSVQAPPPPVVELPVLDPTEIVPGVNVPALPADVLPDLPLPEAPPLPVVNP